MKNNFPVLLLKDMVLFPYSDIRIELDSENDKKLLSLVESYYENILLIVNPKDNLEIDPEIDDLPDYGVLAEIKMKLDMPNGKTRVIISGNHRVKIHSYTKEDNVYEALASEVEIEELSPKEEMAYIRALTKHVEFYVKEIPYVSNTILSQIAGVNNIDKLTDIVAIFLPIDYERKLEYLKEFSSTSRVKMILNDINSDIEILKLEKKIEDEVSHGLEESQREFVLREKIKVIHQELGDDKDDEVENLREKIDRLNCSEKVKDRLYHELNRYSSLNPSSPEVGTIKNYIDWLLCLPWNKETEDRKDLKKVRQILDSEHSGLEKEKDRIIEYLAVKHNSKEVKSPILCLVGPPGVGKTSFAKSIAKGLNRKITKISVGGVNDEAEIVGHRKTYVGSAPGLIIQGMKKAGTSNPVFIIDEIDKMTKDIKGDPASSLLEVLDKEQNNAFCDHYIEEEFDLSRVLFIATANYINQIPEELKDRLEIIEMSSYTEYEKLEIAKTHLIPNLLRDNNVSSGKIKFTDDAILTLIRNYTKEAGVRELERLIDSIIRKIIKEIVVDKSKKDYRINKNVIEKYLGVVKYSYMENEFTSYIGCVNGLAYTPYGGDVLPIEVCMYKGKGELILTGSLGEVMQESTRIALSYIKANHEAFGIDLKLLENKDIHIHLPEGAVPKEGPSAGIALTTALISLFTKRSFPSTISMTGEITLSGKVLPIGGLKEKLIGALRSHIDTVFIPYENKKDLEDIPDYIKKELTIIFVHTYQEIYDYWVDQRGEISH